MEIKYSCISSETSTRTTQSMKQSCFPAITNEAHHMTKKTLPPFLERAVRIRSLEIPPLEKLLLHTLNSRADKAGCCYPSIDTLELDSGLSRSTIFTHLKSLRKRGYVICDRFGSRNHRNIYTLTLFHQDSLAPSIPNTCYKSSSRTRTSPALAHTSPPPELVPVRELYMSYIEEERSKEIIEELNLNFYEKDAHILELWICKLESLIGIIPYELILTWFINLIPISSENDDKITTIAPSAFARNLLNTQYELLLQNFNIKVETQNVSHQRTHVLL